MRANRVYFNNKYLEDLDYVIDYDGNVFSIEEYGNIGGILKNAIVEYSTGLKDKNSVEIYEGDKGLLTFNTYTNKILQEHKIECFIHFVSGAFKIVNTKKINEINNYLCEYNKMYEVIGNIHEE